MIIKIIQRIQAIKVKLEKVHRFVQSRIENPFVSSLIDKMYKNKSGSDIDKKLEMLEGMKSDAGYFP
jgi:hypothetical protein